MYGAVPLELCRVFLEITLTMTHNELSQFMCDEEEDENGC